MRKIMSVVGIVCCLVWIFAGTVEAEALSPIKQSLNDLFVNFLLALITAVGSMGTVLITYLFAYLRNKAKILQYTQIDEKIQEKMLKAWNDARQDVYDGFKHQQGDGNKLTLEQSQKVMQYAISKFSANLSAEELKHLGYQLKDDLMKSAKNAFEMICDASKGKVSVSLGESARLAVGSIKSPIIGAEMKGFEIKAKF